MNQTQTRNYIANGDLPMDSAYSEWAKENWPTIADEKYIRTKAKNILKLLGFKTEDTEKLRRAETVAYATTEAIRKIRGNV